MQMSDADFADVMRIACKLWPKLSESNDEQLLCWRRVCGGHSPDQCIRELRGLAETLKFCPRPAELRARLVERRTRGPSAAPAELPTWPQQVRKMAIDANVENADAMDDRAAQVWYWRWSLDRATDIYGASGGGTTFAKAMLEQFESAPVAVGGAA